MAGLFLVEGPPAICRGAEGSTQSFKCGDPIIISSGLMVVATVSTDIWGIAVQKASATANTILEYHLLLPGQFYAINVDSATTPARASHVGNEYALTISVGATVLNVAGGASTGFVVIDLYPPDTAAAGSRVIVTPAYDICDGIGG